MKTLRLILCLLLAGCQANVLAKSPLLGDAEQWSAYRVQVADQIVEFTIPPKESKAFVGFRIPERIDLDSDRSVFDEVGKGPDLLRRFWDYRASRFSPVDGTLEAIIGIYLSEYPLDDVIALRNALESSSRRFAEKMLREEGHPRAPNPVVGLAPAEFLGEGWFRVDYKLSGSYYVTRLDRIHFLKVAVRPNGFSRNDWQEDAQAAGQRILRSIRIYPAP